MSRRLALAALSVTCVPLRRELSQLARRRYENADNINVYRCSRDDQILVLVHS